MGPDLLRADLAALYPQFGLHVAHAGLELVAPTDTELLELAAIAAEPGGIVEPGREGELLGWPAAGDVGPDAVARHVLEHGWRLRTAPTPARWRAPFAVVEGGRVVGHAVLAHEAGTPERTVVTASWLARAEQGRGLGRRVRLMLLALAFDGLGAARATTGAAEGDAEITASAWRRRRLADVVVTGVEPFRAAVGG